MDSIWYNGSWWLLEKYEQEWDVFVIFITWKYILYNDLVSKWNVKYDIHDNKDHS